MATLVSWAFEAITSSLLMASPGQPGETTSVSEEPIRERVLPPANRTGDAHNCRCVYNLHQRLIRPGEKSVPAGDPAGALNPAPATATKTETHSAGDSRPPGRIQSPISFEPGSATRS